jgi:YVTN family beta-propeller protein
VTLEFRVLGAVEAITDSRRLELGGPKQRSVLALLLLRANEVVPRAGLIDALWGDAPPAAARDTVKVYVGRLRKILGQNGSPHCLVTRGGGYVLQVDPEQLDLHRFQLLASSGSRALAAGETARAARVLREALALWRGPPLADLVEEPFARTEQARLEELRLAALEQRIEADLELGRSSAVVAELLQLTAEHPYRERFHRQLMLALYRSGRQAEALEAYRALRNRLIDDHGLEPDHESQELQRAILAADPALAPPRPPETDATRDEAVFVPRRRRTRGRRIGLLALVLALAATGVVAYRAAVVETPRVGSPSTTPVGRVTGRVSVPLPGGPFVARLAFGAGSLWIRKTGTSEVLRVDPVTNRVIARIPVGFSYDTGIAVRGGDVWVTNGEEGTVSRISAAINAVVATIRVGRYPLGIAATDDAVWVANHHSGTVSRIDPWRNQVASTVPISPPSQFSGPLAAVFADGNVWVADATLGEVIRIDPRRNRTNHVSETGPACGGMTVLGGSVWIASGCEQGVLTRIETNTARVAARIRVPGMAFDVAAGVGSIWATTLRGLLLRIDPATNQIRGRLQLPDAVAVTIGAGYVWVVDRESRSVLRIRPSD